MQLRLREQTASRLAADLAQLQAQIQPHFLFNTLNSIYALAVRGDPATADAIVTLSNFLRYVTEHADGKPVALARELDYLDNYVALQRTRLRETVSIDYRVTGSPAGMSIAPLLLFTYVENAFKHGVSPEEPSEIRIQIELEGDGLRLEVTNRRVEHLAAPAGAGTGLGNARRRLDLLYPGRYTLAIDETEATYTVCLSIDFS